MAGVVQIPEPCHENWQAMQPQANGRFCDSCCKVVVDFTNFSDQEIVDYLQSKKSERVCGRFKTEQVQQTPVPEIILLNNTKQLWNLQRFAAALLLAFGSILFTACGDEHEVGEIERTPTDQLLTDTVKADTQTVLRKKAPECDVITVEGEVQGMIMGPPPVYPDNDYTVGIVVEQVDPFIEEMEKDSSVIDVKKKNIFSRIGDRLKLKR